MFFEVLVSLLSKHGVAIHDVNVTETGEVKIDIDFSEHDKVFDDKIARLESSYHRHRSRICDLENENHKLRQRIAELESRETLELPFDALETANYLINATYERETNGFERTLHNLPDKVNSDRYTVDDLEQIAEHLLVYCKHNKESE